jgi:hypothetical protein
VESPAQIMTSEQDIVRLDTRINRLEEHLDLKFDGINTVLNDHTRQLAELKGLIRAALIIIPATIAFATAVLGWILTHSKFTG